MFEQISNDPYIIDLYKKIEVYEDLNDGWAYHNYSHVKNVVQLVESILNNLEYKQELIEDAKIAAILHDIGCIEGKENHAYRSYEMAKTYFINKNIDLNNQELILEAIKIHSDGFDTDNVIAQVLIFADKLDIKFDRLAKAGFNIDGIRQLQYIKDILVKINNNELNIEFITDTKINKRELESFYFTRKVFKAIESFSKIMNLNYNVTLNNDRWNPF